MDQKMELLRPYSYPYSNCYPHPNLNSNPYPYLLTLTLISCKVLVNQLGMDQKMELLRSKKDELEMRLKDESLHFQGYARQGTGLQEKNNTNIPQIYT